MFMATMLLVSQVHSPISHLKSNIEWINVTLEVVTHSIFSFFCLVPIFEGKKRKFFYGYLKTRMTILAPKISSLVKTALAVIMIFLLKLWMLPLYGLNS